VCFLRRGSFTVDTPVDRLAGGVLQTASSAFKLLVQTAYVKLDGKRVPVRRVSIPSLSLSSCFSEGEIEYQHMRLGLAIMEHEGS